MDALRSRLRLAPGKKNIGGTGLEGKVGTRIKCCFINELPFASVTQGSHRCKPGAPVPVILVATPDLTAKHPDAPAKFPVISAAYSHCKSLILRIQLEYSGLFQARKPQKYPVIETRSRQTATTATQSYPIYRLFQPHPVSRKTRDISVGCAGVEIPAEPSTVSG